MSFDRIRRKLGFSGRTRAIIDGTPKKLYSDSLIKQRMEPNDLGGYEKFVGIHTGESIIVCGCGLSINDFIPGETEILFGVNDINRKFKTKYLLCVNEPHTFKRGRYQWVENNTADHFFTHIRNVMIKRPETAVFFQLGTINGANIDNIGKIDYTANSPYMAAIIAYQMGATKIAIVGVDLVEDHFFEKTGKHVLTNRAPFVDEEYRKLGEALVDKGVKIANLSSISLIKSWPNMTHEEFNQL